MTATEHTAEPYPFDINEIQKGTYIAPEVLERLTGCNRMTYNYSLRLLPIREWLERELAAHGRPATVVQEDFGLKVLTDADASKYNDNRCTASLRAFKASITRMSYVDTKNLDDGQQEHHARRLAYRGAQVAALSSARKKQLSRVTSKELTS